jgi:hypothetical protein
MWEISPAIPDRRDTSKTYEARNVLSRKFNKLAHF